MNYLGRSIIEEVRSTTTDLIPNVDNTYDLGSSLKRWHELYVTNNLPLDVRSLPTQLPNGMFASMCHPMRFSNGVPSGNLVFTTGTVRNYILSGFGTLSAYTDTTTALKYAGTYKYHVSAGFGVIGSAEPVFTTSLNYNVKIGSRTICTASGIIPIYSNFDGGEIDISGTIDMLEDAGTEFTSVYVTMTVSYKLGQLGTYPYSRTWTQYLTDVDTRTDSNYSLEIFGLVDSGVFNVAVNRHIGTLECIYSNVAPVTV